MTSIRGELYQKLFNTYRKCYPDKKSTIVQENVNKIWNNLKEKYKSDGKQFELNIQNNIELLNQKITQNKARNLNFFTNLKVSHEVFIVLVLCIYYYRVYINAILTVYMILLFWIICMCA